MNARINLKRLTSQTIARLKRAQNSRAVLVYARGLLDRFSYSSSIKARPLKVIPVPCLPGPRDANFTSRFLETLSSLGVYRLFIARPPERPTLNNEYARCALTIEGRSPRSNRPRSRWWVCPRNDKAPAYSANYPWKIHFPRYRRSFRC